MAPRTRSTSLPVSFEDFIDAGDFDGAQSLLDAQRAVEDAAQAKAEQIGGAYYCTAIDQFEAENTEFGSLQEALCSALENLCDTHGVSSAAVSCFERLAEGRM